MASIADNFRSKCGSVRRPPECNKQRIPAATPHVGQGTEDNCSGVSSFLFNSEQDAIALSRETVQFETLCAGFAFSLYVVDNTGYGGVIYLTLRLERPARTPKLLTAVTF